MHFETHVGKDLSDPFHFKETEYIERIQMEMRVFSVDRGVHSMTFDPATSLMIDLEENDCPVASGFAVDHDRVLTVMLPQEYPVHVEYQQATGHKMIMEIG